MMNVDSKLSYAASLAAEVEATAGSDAPDVMDDSTSAAHRSRIPIRGRAAQPRLVRGEDRDEEEYLQHSQ